MMIASYVPKQSFWLSNSFLYPLMITLGILSGYNDWSYAQQLAMVIADIFIRLFKCLSLPIIALSIIVSLTNYCTKGAAKTVWRQTLVYTFSTTFMAAVISLLLYLIVKPKLVETLEPVLTTHSRGQFNYLHHLSKLIPETIFSPFLDHQVMSVLLLSIAVGIAVRFIPDLESQQAITGFFRGAHALLMVITGWIIAIIPLGLFGFITATVIQLRSGFDLKGIGQYLFIIVAANLIQGFVILPLWLKTQGIKPLITMKAMLPALSVAFFSKSSIGTLPITIKTAENNVHLKPQITRFVLPLCTSLNMNGCAAFIFVTVIYLMQNNGIIITLSTMILWLFIATIAAIGNAGVPMGCYFLSASLLASMNIPITLMGLILPFYALIDMLETALNVWSDSCVACVVDRKYR